jgi:hypothetical protein
MLATKFCSPHHLILLDAVLESFEDGVRKINTLARSMQKAVI